MSDFAGLNNQSSAEAARNAMRQQQRGATPFGAAFSTPPSSNRGRSRSGDRGVADLFDNMIQPKSSSDQPMPAMLEAPVVYPDVQTGPRVGKRVAINLQKGVDLPKAIQRLDIRLAVNRVRSDMHKQKFHERGGLKRKRLASERWRRSFKEGFDAVAKRVRELTAKGW